ncbi:exopolysaccharide biosynthesis polyprenyl glycosylphosphotransferase [Aeromonas veronii]|uniref:sugar transferase n=1 Tax=Aeromonas veronii TaxID=654 RepID=UPI001327C12E|nr:sugar transferase [Aeromonas veronii]MCF5767183.1 sugar transferase [Aeromonas veronii]MXV28900.1 exopolysaccharide biosynthesis polyprenyl glycosylphosphotransferase [Aeromonas veronii]
MNYQRRHSRWYERVFFSPPALFIFGALLAVCLPSIERWGWTFWTYFDDVRINTMGGAFMAFLLTGAVLYRFLRYPGSSPVAYMIPTVTTLYGAMVGILFFLRLPYSRQVLFESYVVALLCCWLVYFIGRRYRTPKYALLPFGDYQPLTQHSCVEWRLLDKPDLGTVRYDAVVADLRCVDLAGEWERFLAHCALAHIPVYHIKQVSESLTGRVKIDHLHENQLGSLLPSPVFAFFKRGLDISAALIAIPLLSPLMLVTAILIKLESPGPVMFLQNRVGKGNKDFCIYKFRSMCKDSEKAGAQFAQAGDMRVTQVGKVIRKLRIDELPQFFNVLKGDMSLIGPRPEQRTFVDQFEREIPFYMYRHIVRPGISGWAQVVQGYAADADDTRIKIEHDFYYIKHFSLWLDVLIVFKTIKTILTGFGAR